MKTELKLRFPKIPVEQATHYWGGGTPSVLSHKVMESLAHQALEKAPLKPGGEFTLEVNPDDVTSNSLLNWKSIGVNRLSIGVQSFNDNRLEWMNRSHGSSQASESILRAQDAGFENISIDLIYGIPNSSIAEWQDNLGRALDFGVVHLSTYALTVEEKTKLFYQIKKGESEPPKDERAEEDFRWYRKHLNDLGWDSYEISNSCIPGRRSIHNSTYWSGEEYHGIGPGAHSFDGINTRRWNISNNGKYKRAMDVDSSWYEQEFLKPRDMINEKIMTRIRTKEGLDSKSLGTWDIELEKLWKPHVDANRVFKDEFGTWKLLELGLFWADRIASDGFVPEDQLL
tara:strand:+ start:1696 stop:2721 length:1026 start_codon:yes stop_codon:yes gene_type:complete